MPCPPTCARVALPASSSFFAVPLCAHMRCPSVRLRNFSLLTPRLSRLARSPQVACCLVSSGSLLPPCAGDAADAAGQEQPGKSEQEGAAAPPSDGSAAHRAAVEGQPVASEPGAGGPGAEGPVQVTSSAAAGASSDEQPSLSEPADEIAKAREDLRVAAKELRLSLRRLVQDGIRLPRAPPEGQFGSSTPEARAESTGVGQAQQTSPVKRTWSELGLRGIVWRTIVVALSPLVCVPRPSPARF